MAIHQITQRDNVPVLAGYSFYSIPDLVSGYRAGFYGKYALFGNSLVKTVEMQFFSQLKLCIFRGETS
jgi:hypothetical protein